jgi:hypothetical protein
MKEFEDVIFVLMGWIQIFEGAQLDGLIVTGENNNNKNYLPR